MMRYVGLSIATLGIMGVIVEAQSGKVFFSSILLCIAMLIIGTFIYAKNLRVKFPRLDNNGMKKLKVIEDIPLETTSDLDHLSTIQDKISKMKKNDDVLFELVTLQGKEEHIKVTNTKDETLGVIPYTYPHRRYLATRIYDGATVLGKVFKVSRGIMGKRKISISVAPYVLKID